MKNFKEKRFVEVVPIMNYLDGWLEHFDKISVDSRGKKLPVYRRGIVLAIKNFVEGVKIQKGFDIYKEVSSENGDIILNNPNAMDRLYNKIRSIDKEEYDIVGIILEFNNYYGELLVDLNQEEIIKLFDKYLKENYDE